MKKLFLIPTPISEDLSSIPAQVIEVVNANNTFVCERIRTTRRFIKSIIKDFDIDSSTFVELDKRGRIEDNLEIAELMTSNRDICFMSEAGSPCVADPGSELVTMVRKKGYRIIPLSGPSSILLALMSSGMNGQHFTFKGYLPVKKDALKKELKQIDKTIHQTGYTQIFIETPYRNLQLFDQIGETVSDSLRLSINLHIHSEGEYIETKKVKNWKKDNEIKKRLSEKAPCIFILGR